MDVGDHPAIRKWREAQEKETAEEAQEMEAASAEDGSVKPDLKMNLDPKTKSAMDTLMNQFSQEAIFGDAAASSPGGGGGSDAQDWDFDWEGDEVDESVKDEL